MRSRALPSETPSAELARARSERDQGEQCLPTGGFVGTGSANENLMMMVSNRMMWGVLAVAAAAGLAAALLPTVRSRRMAQTDESNRVDEASEDSFPASDPPSFSAPATAVPGPAS